MVKIPFSYPPGVRRWPPKPSCAPIVDKAGLIVTLLPHFISSLRQAARHLLSDRAHCRNGQRAIDRGGDPFDLIHHGGERRRRQRLLAIASSESGRVVHLDD